jgi:hypothetical protein
MFIDVHLTAEIPNTRTSRTINHRVTPPARDSQQAAPS